MKPFAQLFNEERVDRSISSLKTHIKKSVKVKFTDSSRGAYHIRFSLDIDEKKFNQFFRKHSLEVVDYDGRISSKFDTYALVTTKQLGSIPVGTTIPWVNNFIGRSSSGGQLFNNKDLNPDNMGLAGHQVNIQQIIGIVSPLLKAKYDEEVANQLIGLMNDAKSKRNKINLTPDIDFSTKDLAKVSADFGEILAAIWAMTSLGFKEAFFPTASNEKLIDFYGVRMGVQYPISVKSGGGGKVTIQNIIDAINNRAKTANADHSTEKSLVVFKIVNENPTKQQMILLHQYMDTKAIKKLAEIMNANAESITLESIKAFLDGKDTEEVNKLLTPFWAVLNYKPTDRIKEASDKLRLIISPLGEGIWKILNADKEMKTSLTNVARKVTLIQTNVDVKKKNMSFKSNFFKEAEFQFGWAGYAAGNKLGFKMKLKK